MAKKLNNLELLALPNLITPLSGFVSLGAKTDGLYQKLGTVESKLELVGHTHTNTDITGLGNIALINKNNSTANYLRGDGTWVTPPNTTYAVATTSANGLMSLADKSKLDGIATGANNYSLPTASATVLGGVKIGSNISISSGVISVAAPYTHPATHPATIITQDASNRFVSDTEKSTWNAKSNLALGTTSTTAYRGDLGAIAYNHSQSAHDYLPLTGGTVSGETTFNGNFRVNTAIQNYNPFGGGKIYDSINTNLFTGKWNKIKVTLNGVENASNTYMLFDQNYDQYANVSGREGDPPLVVNIDLVSKGLYGSTGVTYASGFVLLNFYSSLLPATYSARVKNKDGVWTNMPLFVYSGSQLKGTIPIGLYLTDFEFTFTTGVGAPYVTGNYKWGLAEIEYHSTRMSLTQGGNITSVGGYIGGNLTIDGTLSASLSGNASTATTLQTARTIWGQSFNGSANISGALTGATTGNFSDTITINKGATVNSSLVLTANGTTTSFGSLNSSYFHINTDASGGFYFYKTITTPSTVTATTLIGALTGNADTATTATKLGTATVGSTQLPFYLNAGTATAITQANLRIGLFGTTAIGSTQLPIYLAANGVPTAITQANLRIGLFGATAIGSSTQPVYIAANGVPTASTSFGGVTGIGTASPLMNGTVAVGTSSLAARQDHTHPVDTSRAAVGQTMYIGTTAVAINRASATLNLTGIGTLAMAGALTGATTISASTSVTTPKVIFAAAGWSLEQVGTELQMKHNGVVKQRMLSNGSIVATGEVTAFGS